MNKIFTHILSVSPLSVIKPLYSLARSPTSPWHVAFDFPVAVIRQTSGVPVAMESSQQKAHGEIRSRCGLQLRIFTRISPGFLIDATGNSFSLCIPIIETEVVTFNNIFQPVSLYRKH